MHSEHSFICLYSFQAGDYDTAYQLYTEAFNTFPSQSFRSMQTSQAWIMSNIATCLYFMGQLQLCVQVGVLAFYRIITCVYCSQACNETLLLDQRQVQAMMIKARAMKSLGRVKEARDMLERILEAKALCKDENAMMDSLLER